MLNLFAVVGPLDVPCQQAKAGRTITDGKVQEFWETNNKFGADRGCYVFGIRAGKGYTPAYVGRATKSFRQEVFAPHKLSRYQQALSNYKRGTPILFFVAAPKKRGAPNSSHIKELEAFLIQTALVANPELLNVKGTKAEEWGIKGVLRGPQGKPSVDAQAFRRLMKINLA